MQISGILMVLGNITPSVDPDGIILEMLDEEIIKKMPIACF
jgi:hypothetical protein